MAILIACEESQAVTKEFRKLGFEAYSCDLLPCSGGHPEWHFKNDVFEIINRRWGILQNGNDIFIDKWDLIIAFPPCTDLAVSGARHFERKIADGSQQKSIDFFMKFVNVDCERVAIENPIGIMSGKYRKPDQIVHPYHFGDKASKSTCLWLKNLPKLAHTNVVDKGEWFEWIDGKTGKKKRQPMWIYQAMLKTSSSEERRTLRSKTFQGIAKAMASQWGEVLNQNKK